METNLKSTFVLISDQTSADCEAAGQSKTPTFHVQTGVRAGGFYDWWQGVAEGWNMRDRSSTGTV